MPRRKRIGVFRNRKKRWLNKALDLAKNLGARVVWVKGTDEAEEMAAYARHHNITKIIIGKPRRFWLFATIPQRLLTQTANIDIYLLDAKAEKLGVRLCLRNALGCPIPSTIWSASWRWPRSLPLPFP